MGVTIKDDPYIRKVLGITWDAERDDFLFSFEEIANDANDFAPTKRSILSIGARIYDPLGFLCPVFIQNKVLFQLTCLRKLNWDDNLPDDVKHKWFKWLNDLRLLNHVTIPRFIGANFTEKCNDICLHGFCDSSTKAYAAVCYIVFNVDGSHVSKIVAAKARVAPLKELSIPRLELLGCLLLAELITSVKNSLKQEFNITKLFC